MAIPTLPDVSRTPVNERMGFGIPPYHVTPWKQKEFQDLLKRLKCVQLPREMNEKQGGIPVTQLKWLKASGS